MPGAPGCDRVGQMGEISTASTPNLLASQMCAAQRRPQSIGADDDGGTGRQMRDDARQRRAEPDIDHEPELRQMGWPCALFDSGGRTER